MRSGNALGRICLRVRPVRALTRECPDLETLFLLRGYIFRTSRSRSVTKVMSTEPRPYKRN